MNDLIHADITYEKIQKALPHAFTEQGVAMLSGHYN